MKIQIQLPAPLGLFATFAVAIGEQFPTSSFGEGGVIHIPDDIALIDLGDSVVADDLVDQLAEAIMDTLVMVLELDDDEFAQRCRSAARAAYVIAFGGHR